MKKVFCGHLHNNAGGFHRDGDMEIVVTTAVGCQINNEVTHGMRLVQVYRDRVEHKFYSLDEFPSIVQLADEDEPAPVPAPEPDPEPAPEPAQGEAAPEPGP